MKTALTIAGSDPSGGAGIQADIKTMTAHGVFATCAITAVTAQNTTGVTGVYNMTAQCLEQQLEAVFTDIFPDSVKIGMVSSAELIHVIAEVLKKYKPKNVVLDTVMVSTSGHRLLAEDAEEALVKELIPLADVITPNLYEAEVLLGKKLEDERELPTAARDLSEKFGTAVLLKGGHMKGNDYLYTADGKRKRWFFGHYIDNPNTHGTGCTLSSALAANLALGNDLADSVAKAKEYTANAIMSGLDLGKGRGPIDHMWNINNS